MTEEELREKIKEAIDYFNFRLAELEEIRYRERGSAFMDVTDLKEQALNEAITEFTGWFKQANYVRLAKDQSLPEVPNACDLAYDVCDTCYRQAQQDMWNNGFRKIEEDL